LRGSRFRGVVELSKDFSAQLTLTQSNFADTVFWVNAEGDFETKMITLIGHIKKPISRIKAPDLNVWIGGIFDWKPRSFEGSIHGQKYPWKMQADISLNEEKMLSLTSTEVETDGFSITGELNVDLNTRQLLAKGMFLEKPFSLQSHLYWTKSELIASNLVLHYSNDLLKGDLKYTFKERDFDGVLDLELSDLTYFPIEHPLQGAAKAHIVLSKEQIVLRLTADQIEWKDLYMSQMSIEGIWKEQTLTFQIDFKQFIVQDPAYEVFPELHLELKGKASSKRIAFEGNVWGLGTAPFSLY